MCLINFNIIQLSKLMDLFSTFIFVLCFLHFVSFTFISLINYALQSLLDFSPLVFNTNNKDIGLKAAGDKIIITKDLHFSTLNQPVCFFTCF